MSLPRKHGFLVQAPSRSQIVSGVEVLCVVTVALLVLLVHWDDWNMVTDTHWLIWHVYILKWDYIHMRDPARSVWDGSRPGAHISVEAERDYRFQVRLLTLVDMVTIGMHIDMTVGTRDPGSMTRTDLWVQLGILVAVALITASRMAALFSFRPTKLRLSALNGMNHGMSNIKRTAEHEFLIGDGKHDSDASFF